MARFHPNQDVLSGVVTEFNPGRGSVDGNPYTTTSVPLSLTATHTLMGLQGPGVVCYAGIHNIPVSSPAFLFRVHVDGYDYSFSTSQVTNGYTSFNVVGANAAGGETFDEQIPFRDSFKVMISRNAPVSSTLSFKAAYRLVGG